MNTALDTMEAPECGFVGNPEIYGIGIRLGFYTQALAAWFANYFIASEARVLRPANLLYILVLEIAIVIYAATPDEGWEEGGVYAIEVFVMLTILFAIGFVTISDTQPRYSRRYLAVTPAYTSSFQLLAVLALVFGNWFWWHGLDMYKSTPCGTPIWVFVHVDLYGWVRRLGQAVNVYLLIWYWAEFMQSLPILFKRLFIRAPIRQFMDPGPQNSFVERCRIKWAEAIGGEALRQESILPRQNGWAETPAGIRVDKGFISRQREKIGRFIKGRCVKIPWRRSEDSKEPSSEQIKAFERIQKAEEFLDCVVGESINLPREELLTIAIRETYWNFLSDLFRVGRKVAENYLMSKQKERQGSISRVESYKVRSFMRFNPALQYLISVAEVFEQSRAPKTPVTRSDGKGRRRRRRDILGTIQLVHSVQQHARMRRVDILLLDYVTQKTLTTPKPEVDDLWKWVELASQAHFSRQSLKTRDATIMSPDTPGLENSKDFSKKLTDGWKIAATADIVILIILIAQIETTLVWNNVSDINEIKSFGQLLGFFVGVFGLLTVVYRKTSDEIHNIRQASKKPEKTPFDDAVRKYAVWKREMSRRGGAPPRVLHESKTEPQPLQQPASQERPRTGGRRATMPQRPSVSITASTQGGVAPHD